MIRKLLNRDIDRVADIWLKTNLKAHYFISNQYWKSNYELVKEMLSQSEVYVFEADKMIQGFVGLNDEYIEGIFVSDEMQSCGVEGRPEGRAGKAPLHPDGRRCSPAGKTLRCRACPAGSRG